MLRYTGKYKRKIEVVELDPIRKTATISRIDRIRKEGKVNKEKE